MEKDKALVDHAWREKLEPTANFDVLMIMKLAWLSVKQGQSVIIHCKQKCCTGTVVVYAGWVHLFHFSIKCSILREVGATGANIVLNLMGASQAVVTTLNCLLQVLALLPAVVSQLLSSLAFLPESGLHT